MRMIGYSLVVLMAFVLLSGLGWWISELDILSDDEETPGYRRVSSYVLDQDRSLVFDYTQATTSATLLLHAVFKSPGSALNDVDPIPYNYSIEYRFPNQQAFTDLALSTQTLPRVDEVTGAVTPIYRLSQPDFQVSDSRGIQLALPDVADKSLELRLKSHDPRIAKVIVRSFHREGTELKNSDLKWTRLGRWERSRLSRFHPFGRNYLSKREIRNVLSNRNQSVAPSGISGDDFQIVPLLVHEEPDTLIALAGHTLDQSGANFGGHMTRSIRVRKPTLVDFFVQTAGQRNSHLSYIQRARGNQIGEGRIALPEQNQVSEFLTEGDYIFSAGHPMWLEILPNDDLDISEVRRKFYTVRSGGLRYELAVSPYANQVLRVESVAAPDQVVNVDYVFYDASGNVIDRGQIVHRAPLDGANRLDGSGSLMLSAIQKYVLKVPIAARSVRIKADHDSAMIRLSNSLETLASKVSVTRLESTFSSNWFGLEPTGRSERHDLTDPGQYQLTEHVVISSGRYGFDRSHAAPQVKALQSDSPVLLSRVLEPLTQFETDNSGSIIFTEIESNTNYQYKLDSMNDADDTMVQSAIYFAPQEAHRRIAVRLDQRDYSYDLSSSLGLINFPSLAVGNHQLTLTAPDDVRLFVNYLPSTSSSRPTQQYKLRTLHQTKARRRFVVEQPDVSSMTLQVIIAVPDVVTRTVALDLFVGDSNSERRLRRIEIDPSTSLKGINLDTNSKVNLFAPIYVVLDELAGYPISHFDVRVNIKNDALISLALLDATGASFNHSFIDKLKR